MEMSFLMLVHLSVHDLFNDTVSSCEYTEQSSVGNDKERMQMETIMAWAETEHVLPEIWARDRRIRSTNYAKAKPDRG